MRDLEIRGEAPRNYETSALTRERALTGRGNKGLAWHSFGT